MVEGVKPSCVICAWREGCQKKYSIVNPAMCPDFSPDMSIKGVEGVKGPKLVIEGVQGSGKSKLMDRLVTKLGGRMKLGGFYTRDIIENGRKVGVKIVTVDKHEGVLAHEKSESRVRVGEFGVNVQDIDRVAVPSIERAIHEGALVIIDEIGAMELSSGRLRDAVEEAIKSPNPVVATVRPGGDAFAAKVVSGPDIQVLRLSQDNRDEVLEQAADILSGG